MAIFSVYNLWTGDNAAIIIVFEFPPRAFLSNIVNLESRKGTTVFLPSALSASALIQLPRLDKDWLIAAPSDEEFYAVNGLDCALLISISSKWIHLAQTFLSSDLQLRLLSLLVQNQLSRLTQFETTWSSFDQPHSDFFAFEWYIKKPTFWHRWTRPTPVNMGLV